MFAMKVSEDVLDPLDHIRTYTFIRINAAYSYLVIEDWDKYGKLYSRAIQRIVVFLHYSSCLNNANASDAEEGIAPIAVTLRQTFSLDDID